MLGYVLCVILGILAILIGVARVDPVVLPRPLYIGIGIAFLSIGVLLILR